MVTAARGAVRSTLVVGGRAFPGAETLAHRAGQGTGRVMRVEQGQQVGGQGAVVGFFEAGEGEGSRDEEAGCGI